MKKSMGQCTKSLFFLLGWNILYCDATITLSLINSANGVDTLECRSDGIVSCSINPYANLINWVIDTTPYVTCAPGCSVNPIITRTYSPTYDFTNGIFNLTVDSATFSDNSTTFKCDDGSLSDEITIEVVPAYSENKTSINGTQVGCITACVQPDVEFEWFTVKTDNSDRVPYNKGQNETTEAGECSLDLDCGGVGTVKVSSIITVPTVSKGEERYIEVVVKYKNPYEERTFRFDQTFTFEVSVPDCPFHCGWIIFLIYGSISIFLLIVFSVGYYCITKFQKYIEESDLECWCFVPIIGIICTAYLLYDNQREHYSRKSWIIFIICCILDISILIVMILTCTDTIEEQCDIYGWYALPSLILSKMYIVSLSKCLQKGNNICDCRYDCFCKQCRNEDIAIRVKITKSETAAKPKWTCKSCNQPQQIESKLENKCIDCKSLFCEPCTREHLKIHNPIRFTHLQKHNPKALKDSVSQAANCVCSRGRNNAESYCLKCQQYMCKVCITNHPGHRILSHCQQEAGETQCEIVCTFCENKHIDKKAAKYYNSANKSFVCEDCKSIIGGIQDFIALDDLYFHSETNVESYCLSCQQFLCSLCFTMHVEHKILRHSHLGTGVARSPILCKYCQNLNMKVNAKYYSESDKSFFCKDGMPEIGLGDTCIIAVDGNKWKCMQCEKYPVECKDMINKKKLCTACMVIGEGTTYSSICALHSGCSVTAEGVIGLQSDVLCLVCDEYLCKKCFKQHLDLKQLWLHRHPVKKELKKQIKSLLKKLAVNESIYEVVEESNVVIPSTIDYRSTRSTSNRFH